MRQLRRTIAATMLICVFPVVTTAGQTHDEATDQLRRRLRPGDRVWVDIEPGDVHQGRIVDVSDDGVRLRNQGVEQLVPTASIVRVRRKRNGVLLGTLIGLGVGIACGLPLASLLANEGGNAVGGVLFLTGVGAGAGAGLDGLLSLRRTVYVRRPPGSPTRP